MRKLALAAVLPLLLACASQPKLAGRYAIDASPALQSGRAAYDVRLIYEPLVAALGRRVTLIDSIEEADAVIVLRPGPAYGTLSYDIIRGRDLEQSRVTAAPALVRSDELQTVGERLERQRRVEYARGDRTIVVRREQMGRALPQAEVEDERRTRPLATANRIADQIVKDLAKL
ncbi:MAG TPA: hypothetical protein VF266_19060 [Thermoanaerobaculia bacterium]